MDDKKWAKLFELIDEVIEIKGCSASERGDMIVEKSRDNASDGNLGEFLACIADKLD